MHTIICCNINFIGREMPTSNI